MQNENTGDVVWLPCPRYYSYKVSSVGQIMRSAHIRKGRSRNSKSFKSFIPSKILKQTRQENGYMRIGLYDGQGRNVHELVHRLVCEAFHGPQPPDKPQVDHRNGVRTDNYFKNLVWADYADQRETARKLGTLPAGERHYKSKLTDQEVRWVRLHFKARDKVYGAKPLADRFGVTRQCISSIAQGRNR